MRMPNLAIKRERHLTPMIDDILSELTGSCWFSKMDLRSGYHQIMLHPESRPITTFSTHNGLWGLQKQGLKLHKDKCDFLKEEICFFGYHFSKHGVGPDPQKVKDIQEAPAPTTVTGVRSFLGMVTYYGQFMKNLADITGPLRQLTQANQPWVWGEEQEAAFQATKMALSADTTLVFFDPYRHSQLVVNAIPTGLGALLTQKQDCGESTPIAFASHPLTPTEQKYSQINVKPSPSTGGAAIFTFTSMASRFLS
ncbi:hypothetical protein NDU88_003511 [Pleurodeles waltl]|uniref:Reverse transcriptase/retrotransposon-derived protein RNase H-like domain-containing protein n=1 Tax=Pleurodeles waltl TaxID=8319 RepID=A0AAV7UCR3_PLEWA|nr:hypothetical protein NDU88_003511 [Pleurodeles waltl]